MQDQIQAVIDNLAALKKSIAEYGDVDDKLAAAKAQLEAAVKDHSLVARQLADKSKLLDTERAKAIEAHDKDMFEKTKALRQLTDQVKAKTAEYDELQSLVNTARVDHEGIVASMEALRKRLG